MNFRTFLLNDIEVQTLLPDSLVDMSECNFERVNVNSSLFLNVYMVRADISYAEFFIVTFENVNFNDSIIGCTQFNNYIFIKCSFKLCQFWEIDFSDSITDECTCFYESTMRDILNLSFVNFKKLDLTTVKSEEIIIDESEENLLKARPGARLTVFNAREKLRRDLYNKIDKYSSH